MLSLPEPVAEAVANGQITDVTVAKELAVAYREDPKAVEELLKAPEQKPTRAAVNSIRKGDKSKGEHPSAKETERPDSDDATARLVVGQASTRIFLANDKDGRHRELPDAVKAEFQRRRDVLEQEQSDAANPALRQAGIAALNRLIEIAKRDTGQSERRR
ncbi:hypothetical protein G6F63_014537 [Rhizopus arrhizus]|nr:hypothetical protein G6F63_014537 [Rhizopus arrhizus]